ncbi:hypothetical protein KUCAC02_006213, partial [Chaenocephalus aceratus]
TPKAGRKTPKVGNQGCACSNLCQGPSYFPSRPICPKVDRVVCLQEKGCIVVLVGSFGGLCDNGLERTCKPIPLVQDPSPGRPPVLWTPKSLRGMKRPENCVGSLVVECRLTYLNVGTAGPPEQ